MPQVKLTQTNVQSLQPSEKRQIFRDLSIQGLVLFVEPSGKKTWYIDYKRPGGQRTYHKIGSAEIFTVMQARDVAQKFLASVKLGDDPLKAEEVKKERITLKQLISDHYSPWVIDNRKSGKETVVILMRTFKDFMEMPLEEISMLAIEQWCAKICQENDLKASSLNRQVTALKAAISWAVKRGMINVNPMARLERLREEDDETKKRYLSPEERERSIGSVSSLVRIKDVAKFGNISISSVSRFLNAPETLRPETFQRVKEAIEALQYSPSPIARSLRTKSTDRIALIIPSLTNMYYIDLYSELYDIASSVGYTVNLLSTNGDHDVLRKYLHELPLQSIDGIMVCYLDDDESLLDDFRNAQRSTPLVLITSMQNRQEFNSIFLDVEEGEIRATQHMIDMGCSRLAFVGGERIGSTNVKQRGFEHVLNKNGLKINPDFCFFDRNYFATGFKAVRHFLTLPQQPDGIVCATDDIAIGCVKYLLLNGFKIPEDVRVMGHNGISLIDAIEPSISSLSHPVKDIVEEAMRLLRKQIDHPHARQQQIILYTSLIVNTSTNINAPVRLTERK